ncbi:MAG TPA: Bcr/CflA family multidrug efflux MFS transporter [Ktedonobacteraceae bacterium]|jgi:DHA1 family bicyclomycin/chloramphenicol resistance-like MFS transporter|nr:Bcr/CflA family multidrug efflux MFS transporter [Ktedonobacteraceae bacterium]
MDNSSQVVATDDETRQQTSALKGWRRVQLVLILGSLSAFGPLSIDMYLPSLPALSRDLNASASAAQLTLSACLLGLAFGQVIAGPLSDTLGRRRPLLIGLIAYTVASLLCVVAPSVYILIALRLVQGMAGAAGIVIARAIVRDMFSGVDVARFFSILMLVSGIAPIAAPLVGGLLLRFTSWRGVFVVLAVLVTLMLLAVITGLRETLPVERRQSGKLHYTLATFRRLLLDRLFVGYALSCGLAFAAMFAYISGSPFVIQDIYGLSPQMFSLIFGINALGIGTAGQISGRLVGRVSSKKLLAGGLIAVAIGGTALLLVVIMHVGLIGILPSLFVVVASMGIISPNATALALADYPHIAGSASALLGVLQFSVGAAVAPLVGIAGTETALPMALVIAILDVSALMTYLLLDRRGVDESISSPH